MCNIALLLSFKCGLERMMTTTNRESLTLGQVNQAELISLCKLCAHQVHSTFTACKTYFAKCLGHYIGRIQIILTS